MKKVVGNFWYAILAGVAIAVGGTSFLFNMSMDGSKLVGSVLFCAGLYAVCTLGFNLFTGKVGFVFENDPKQYLPFLVYVWIGNYVGSIIWGTVIRYVYAGNEKFLAAAEKVATGKINKASATPFALFVLAILCNFLVVLAVEEFIHNKHELGKYLGILACITTFVFLGFEHSIANMYYMAVAGKTTAGFLNIVIVTLGNIVGGVIIPGSRKFKAWCDR
ncbi:MAG: formate/nitrite transporter family protein [Eubacteriales bacterium]|nr:formate/nitrite transporter family protein [Eubacteriales bacterium]